MKNHTNFDAQKFKNIDISSFTLHKDIQQFTIFQVQNQIASTQFGSYKANKNDILLFFNIEQTCKIAFNLEHCEVSLVKNESCLVYIRDTPIHILFSLPENSHVVCIQIPISYFHSLFSSENNYLTSFENFKIGKPIIDKKNTNTNLQIVIHQLISKSQKPEMFALYVKGKFYELLSYYFDNTTNQLSEKCPFLANEETVSQFKKVKEYIIEHMAEPPSLEELAKISGINIKKLKEGFKEIYGVPVFTYLLNYKLELARNLLLENRYNVNEIGIKIGYSTSSHFIAAFKKKYGITPKQFIKQNSNL